MSDVVWDIFLFWFRGWGWWIFMGVFYEFDKIFSYLIFCVFEVFFVIVEVMECGIFEIS